MLCNEGHRQALKARKERDKTRYKLINIQSLHHFLIHYLFIHRINTGDFLHPLLSTFLPADILLSDDYDNDNNDTELFNSNLSKEI